MHLIPSPDAWYRFARTHIRSQRLFWAGVALLVVGPLWAANASDKASGKERVKESVASTSVNTPLATPSAATPNSSVKGKDKEETVKKDTPPSQPSLNEEEKKEQRKKTGAFIQEKQAKRLAAMNAYKQGKMEEGDSLLKTKTPAEMEIQTKQAAKLLSNKEKTALQRRSDLEEIQEMAFVARRLFEEEAYKDAQKIARQCIKRIEKLEKEITKEHITTVANFPQSQLQEVKNILYGKILHEKPESNKLNGK